MSAKDVFEKMAPALIEALLKGGANKTPLDPSGDKVAVLKLHGAIMPGGGGGIGGKQNLNIDTIQPKLDAISRMKDVKALALDINCPGGSPVQSRLIADAIQDTAAEMGVPTLAFVQDVAASGGYWLACAADEIFVQPESVVGSIGVVSAGFGFDKLIDKLGVERRVYTAGESKVSNDPFQPENEAGVEKMNALREQIHDNFIDWVKESRGDKLDPNATLFEADVFTGKDGVANGLVDDIGNIHRVVKQRFGANTKLVKPMAMPTGLEGLFNMASEGVQAAAYSVGEGLANGVVNRAEIEAQIQQYRFK